VACVQLVARGIEMVLVPTTVLPAESRQLRFQETVGIVAVDSLYHTAKS
jgi:hypothetical protein